MSYVLLLLLSLPGLLLAQEETLEPIQVKAGKKVSEFNFSKPVIINSTELEKQPFALVAPALLDVPGVTANQNGGPGGRVSFFIRGTESRHVAFTLDGLKLNDPSNVDRQFDAAFFSSPFLKQVDVHKGPQAVLFGSDSLGGLIELTSRKGENARETRVDFNAGSFGTVDASVSHDWKAGKNRGTLTAYDFRSDGLSRLNKKRFKATERDGSQIAQLSSSSTHDWHEKISTDLLLSYLQGKNELDGNQEDNTTDESKNDQYLLQQRTNLNLSKTNAVSLRNGVNHHNRLITAKNFSGVVKDDSFSGDIIQNEALYKFQGQNLNLLGGVATEHEELNISGLDRSFDLHSVFLQSALKMNKFRFQLGTRAEHHVRYGDFVTGSGGAAVELGANIFSVQYSQGFKAPSLYQLYAPPSFGFNIGNSELVPEVNHSWEVAWNYRNNVFESGVTFFQNRLSNLITYTMANGYVNQARFISEGVELSGKFKQRGYHLISSFTHQDFHKEEAAVLRRPLNAFMGGIVVFPTDSSEVTLKGRWFSSRKDVDENFETTTLSGYEVFDLGVRYMFTQVDVGVQLINIMNREYEELYGYNVMPRSIFFHGGVRF
jgi:vitamin B12 transporter